MSPDNRGFRRAELIELHDRGVAIHPKQYSDALAGWSEYGPETRYVIDGSGLADLADYFGIELKTKRVKDKGTQKEYSRHLEHEEITLLRKPTEKIGMGYTATPTECSHEIKELWAKVVSANLLEIRFVTVFGGEGAEREEITQEVAYSGSFSVWWSQEKTS